MPDAPKTALLACVLATGVLGVTAPATAATAPVPHTMGGGGHHELQEAEERLGTELGLNPHHGSFEGHGHAGGGVPAASLETGDVHPAGELGDHDHGEHGDHDGDHAEPNLFAGSILQSLAAIVAFVLLLLILRKYAWGQILTGLQDRENKIKDDLQHARTQREEAQAVLADYENQRKGLQAEGQRIIDEARKAGEAVKVKLVADAEAHAGRLRERAEKEIVAAKETAIAEVYEKSAVLSTEIAAKILGREINADDQRDLVSDSLREFESRAAANN